MSRRVVVGGVRAAGLAELAEEGPLQRPERSSGLGEDPSVEVEPVGFLDGALVRWRGGISHRRRGGPFCGGARCSGAVERWGAGESRWVKKGRASLGVRVTRKRITARISAGLRRGR